jgi:hypothetical protein
LNEQPIAWSMGEISELTMNMRHQKPVRWISVMESLFCIALPDGFHAVHKHIILHH